MTRTLVTKVAGSRVGSLIEKIRSTPGVLVLAYHRIGDAHGTSIDRGVFSATCEDFDYQLKFLKQHADPISPDELRTAVHSEKGRYFLVTFDDGYRDNYTSAVPILKANNLRALFFVATSFTDEPHLSWWDEISWMIQTSPRKKLDACHWFSENINLDKPSRYLAAVRILKIYKAMPFDRSQDFLEYLRKVCDCPTAAPDAHDLWMSWDQLREMRNAGMWIGGHTHTHPILARLPRQQQLGEITTCRKRLEAELGQKMRYFSYPRGKPDSFTNETRDCLQHEGVELAFSYYGGYERCEQWDAFDIRRAAVNHDVYRHEFRAMVQLPTFFA